MEFSLTVMIKDGLDITGPEVLSKVMEALSGVFYEGNCHVSGAQPGDVLMEATASVRVCATGQQ